MIVTFASYVSPLLTIVRSLPEGVLIFALALTDTDHETTIDCLSCLLCHVSLRNPAERVEQRIWADTYLDQRYVSEIT